MKIEIDTRAVGKARPRFTRSGRCYTPKKTADYEKLISTEWQKCGVYYGDAPIAVSVEAYFTPPKSSSKRVWQNILDFLFFTKKPDVDNILKSVLDGLNGVAYEDDKQVVEAHVIKRYSETDKVIIDVDVARR